MSIVGHIWDSSYEVEVSCSDLMVGAHRFSEQGGKRTAHCGGARDARNCSRCIAVKMKS
jgi:hypothetical protein